MKALIWKEWRENLKWIPLPGLVILLVFLIDKPLTPMPEATVAYFLCVIAVVFGAALGFLQIFSEAHGDQRSLLLHRPISRARIFLAKASAGVGLYVLALGIPFVCLEWWMATPGKMPAPYHWQTALPWLADILTGLVYYFAGMLTAQREARWYGSRGLALVSAFLCSCLVWTLPEFWQALAAIGIFGLFAGVAAYGSFSAGGEYAPQPRLSKVALAVTLLTGLLILSVLGKQMIGEGFDSGIDYHYLIDRQGRVLFEGFKPGVGQVGKVTYLNAEEAPAHQATALARAAEEAPDRRRGLPTDTALHAFMETPLHWSYRQSGRFYVHFNNDSIPSLETWYYDQTLHRVLGYDSMLHQCIGSFGPDGFSPPGQEPGESFQGEFRYRTDRWHALDREYLAFPEGIYAINFSGRKVRWFFVPPEGEIITFADRWEDPLDGNRTGVVVSTDKSFHFLTTGGTRLISVPRVFDREKHGYVYAGPLEEPARFFVWYQSWQMLLEPDEFKTTPSYVLEYDAAGHELARQTVPPVPFAPAPYAESMFGLVTPMTEAATLVATTRHLRSEERFRGSTQKSVFLRSLESSRFYIPGTSRDKVTPSGLVPGYVGLMLLSALACAAGCFLLARHFAFSRWSTIAWAIVGFFFSWVGLLLMLALPDWPARLACPKCRKLRVVTRETCEHCGAPHATPPVDGTEIFEPTASGPHAILAAR